MSSHLYSCWNNSCTKCPGCKRSFLMDSYFVLMYEYLLCTFKQYLCHENVHIETDIPVKACKMNLELQNLRCACKSFTSLGEVATDDSSPKCIRTVVVDFGTVHILKEYVQFLDLPEFKTKELLTFKIKRDPEVNPLYRVFRFSKYEGFIKPGKPFRLKIIYSPILNFDTSVDNFEFVDDSLNVVKIVTKGIILGPAVCMSAKELTFYGSYPKKSFIKTVELKNVSEAPVEFIFNYDKHIFQVEPSIGTLAPSKHVYLTFTFTPKTFGCFAQQMNCLIWNHHPVVIYLTGLYGAHDTILKSVKFNRPRLLFEETIGYSAYMRDGSTAGKRMPLTLSSNIVDFESLQTTYKKGAFTESVTVMNHMSDEIDIVWPTDDSKVFSIKPVRTKVFPSKTCSFECSYRPDKCCAAYCKYLTAQVYWNSPDNFEKVQNVPLNIDLILLGLSYSKEDWMIRSIEIIPEEIILAPCVPGMVQNHNFKIKNLGPIPLPYRIYPRKATDIKMKPALGLIQDFGIICVELKTEDDLEKYYNEIWNLELYGNKKSVIPISVRCQTTVPSIVVGINNVVNFGVIQPGILLQKEAPVRNTSNLQVRISMVVQDNELIKIEPPSFSLAAHEEAFMTVRCTSSVCAPEYTNVTCTLNAITKIDQWIGDSYRHQFVIQTKCLYSQLCADPNNIDFGEVYWNSLVSTTFYIFNFGESSLDYTLKYLNRSCNHDEFEITPRSGVLKPKEKQKVQLQGRVKTLGDNFTIVSYNNALDTIQEEQDNDDEPICLVQIIYICSYATIRVEEIVEHTFGHLFSKEHFWNNYIQAHAFNELLKDTSEKTNSIHLQFPECETSKRRYSLTVLLRNESKFDINVTVKRKKVCDCALREFYTSINKTTKIYECPHREMLTLELSDNKLCPFGQSFLTFLVKYTLPGTTRLAYTIQLGDYRTLELFITITTIPEKIPKLSYYSNKFSMDLKNVYVGQTEGPVQFFWLYNNTRQTLKYEANTEEIGLLCQREGFKVLEMLNPSGEVESYDATPLKIRFLPIENKIYKVSIPINLAGKMENLCITGCGMTSPTKNLTTFEMPVSSYSVKQCPVTLSLAGIEINPIRIWSNTERMIFMNNVTKDKIIQFEWKISEVRDIVRIRMIPGNGVLKPKESTAVLVKIETFNETAVVDMVVYCILEDYVEEYKYKQSVIRQEVEQKKLETEFVFVDNEFVQPKKVNIPLEKKSQAGTINLSLKINILPFKNCSTSDAASAMCLNVDVRHLTGMGQRGIRNSSEGDKYYADANGAKMLLEQLISDFVFSASFDDTLKTCAIQAPPYYHQFLLDERFKQPSDTSKRSFIDPRNRAIEKYFVKPQLPLVSSTLKQIIFDGVRNVFKLGSQVSGDVNEAQLDREVEKILKKCPPQCTCENK